MSTISGSAHQPLQSDYGEWVREVRRRELLHPRPGYYLLLGCSTLTGLLLLVTGLVLLRDSWWAILLAPGFTIVSTQIAFFAHDAAHRHIAQSRRAVAVLCLVHGNLLNGLSYATDGGGQAQHSPRPPQRPRDRPRCRGRRLRLRIPTRPAYGEGLTLG